MKKAVAFCAALVMLTMITSCGSSRDTISSKQSHSSSAVFVQSSVAKAETSEAKSSKENVLTEEGKEFPITVNDLVNVIDRGLSSSEYTLVSKLKPDMSNSKHANFGETKCYHYSLQPGVDLMVYADPKNNNVVSLEYYVTISKATTQSMKYYGCCVGTTIKYMADDEAESVDSELKLNNIAEDSTKSADSELCSFVYIVNKGTAMLLIDPRTA